MKSMPASARDRARAAVSCGPKPTLGLTIVPRSGRPCTPASFRVPSMPNCGPSIGVGEGRRHADVEETQAGELLQLEQVACDGRDQVGQRRAQVLDRPGEGDPRLPPRPVAAARLARSG